MCTQPFSKNFQQFTQQMENVVNIHGVDNLYHNCEHLRTQCISSSQIFYWICIILRLKKYIIKTSVIQHMYQTIYITRFYWECVQKC